MGLLRDRPIAVHGEELTSEVGRRHMSEPVHAHVRQAQRVDAIRRAEDRQMLRLPAPPDREGVFDVELA